MALNTSLISDAYAFAVANPAAARDHGWLKRNSFGALTPVEDIPELRRQMLAIRHVFPVSLAQGWAA